MDKSKLHASLSNEAHMWKALSKLKHTSLDSIIKSVLG